MYKCDNCGKTDNNAVNFREVVGNVMVPDSGGLIGQNIFDEKSEWAGSSGFFKVEKNRLELGKLPVSLDGGTIRVYSSIFCIACYLKASGITKGGKSKWATTITNQEETP